MKSGTTVFGWFARRFPRPFGVDDATLPAEAGAGEGAMLHGPQLSPVNWNLMEAD
jgi:hypothetical protein